MKTPKELKVEIERVEFNAWQLGNLENLSSYKDPAIYEMATYKMDDSGLPYNLWIDEVGKDRTIEHSIPRLKVLLSFSNSVPISIEQNPKILLKGVFLAKAERELNERKMKDIYAFIRKNKDMLIKHWNKEIDYNTLKAYMMQNK
jgi:hypothetical protein